MLYDHDTSPDDFKEITMYFKLKSNILFRNYGSFGYLTDNRNFGYKSIGKNENNIGDKILSESGAVFLSVLNKIPQTIDDLAIKIKQTYSDCDIRTITADATEFYLNLEQDGFIVSGETAQKCFAKDKKFSYKSFEPDVSSNNSFFSINHPEKTTQDFFDEYFEGKPQLTNLHIEITSICNEKCLHCYIPHENKVNHIEPVLFFEILNQCKDLKLLHITLSGGEPMLHKNFCDFLRNCREYDISVNVLSNLTLLNDEIISEMSLNPLLGVQVSLYSMNPLIHDEITQMQGSFAKTKNSILRLIENDIPLQVSCPILKQNKNCFEDVIKWGEMNKIHVGEDFGIIGSYNHTTQNLSCRLSIDEIKEVISNKVTKDSNYLEKVKIAAEKKKHVFSTDSVCSVCHSSICIAENGNVYPCAGWQGYVVGNIKESMLKDIWEHSEKVQYLRGLQNQHFPKCIECSDKAFCTICMVRNANENPEGDPLDVNEFFCSVTKLNREILYEWEAKHPNY